MGCTIGAADARRGSRRGEQRYRKTSTSPEAGVPEDSPGLSPHTMLTKRGEPNLLTLCEPAPGDSTAAQAPVCAVAFAADGSCVVSCLAASDITPRCYCVSAAAEGQALPDMHKRLSRSTTFGPGAQNDPRYPDARCDAAEAGRHHVAEGHSSPITDLCAMGGGNIIATCSRDSTVCIWARNSRHGADFSLRKRMRFSPDPPAAAEVGVVAARRGVGHTHAGTEPAQAGECILPGSPIAVHAVQATAPPAPPPRPRQLPQQSPTRETAVPGLRAVRGSPNGLYVVAAVEEEGMLCTEDIIDDDDLFTTAGSRGGGRVVVWNARTSQQSTIFARHTQEVLCIAFASTSDAIASGSRDGSVFIWAAESGKVLLELPASQSGQSAVLSCGFSSNGSWLATCDAGSLYVWDARNGTRLFSMRANEELEVPGLRAVVFVGGSHIVAAAAGTPRVIIIDAVTASVVSTLPTPAPVACLASWQRGAAVLGDVDGGIHVLYLPMLVDF